MQSNRTMENTTMSRNVAKVGLLLLVVIVAAVTLVRYNRVELPDGPVEVVWDSEVCTHCKMHVGDPRFAAQLQTEDGRVLNFDDPGCLFEYLSRNPTSRHALFFREHDGDYWLAESEAEFVSVPDSPMGYQIGAVRNGTEGGHDLEWAKARALNRGDPQEGEVEP